MSSMARWFHARVIRVWVRLLLLCLLRLTRISISVPCLLGWILQIRVCITFVSFIKPRSKYCLTTSKFRFLFFCARFVNSRFPVLLPALWNDSCQLCRFVKDGPKVQFSKKTVFAWINFDSDFSWLLFKISSRDTQRAVERKKAD